MNVILDSSGQVPWHTDMAATLDAMGVDPKAYEWYVSDVETNAYPDAKPLSSTWRV